MNREYEPFQPTPYEPSAPASFTPTQGNFKTLQPFRYWCQKVLPLVYDDSLSYYELLCKVVDYLNKTMDDVETLHTDVDNLHTAYEELQEDYNTKYAGITEWVNQSYQDLVTFVNTYFENLDVQEEINNKLDAMALDGSLSALLAPYIPDIVTAWLNEHVDPVGSAVIVDNTLLISGAAADAKVTGKIRDIVDTIVAEKLFSLTNKDTNGYMASGENPSYEEGTIVTTSAGTYYYKIVPVRKGEWINATLDASLSVDSLSYVTSNGTFIERIVKGKCNNYNYQFDRDGYICICCNIKPLF